MGLYTITDSLGRVEIRRFNGRGLHDVGKESFTSPIKAIQKDLKRIGADVRPTGVADQATVEAVNNVFNGWDDAPSALRGGDLTAGQITKNAKVVARYLHKAVGETTTFTDVNE